MCLCGVVKSAFKFKNWLPDNDNTNELVFVKIY